MEFFRLRFMFEPATLLKKNSMGIILWICAMFQNSFYIECQSMTASELGNNANSLAFKGTYYERETMKREAFADRVRQWKY